MQTIQQHPGHGGDHVLQLLGGLDGNDSEENSWRLVWLLLFSTLNMCTLQLPLYMQTLTGKKKKHQKLSFTKKHVWTVQTCLQLKQHQVPL